MISDFRIGTGFDSHRLEEGRRLTIGGIDVPFAKGCVAHSDGDVLIHAIIDALLGSLALKDIGTHFPDHDPQYKNADSKQLLALVVKLIIEKNWTVHQIDTTIILEQPKLSPYIEQMTGLLSDILKVPSERVSIKVKTNEKMGAIGRGEGVAAMATIVIIKS
ncbi:MAG: 2-C-methyl-D-erythritol 2,4-cyclodiphosphate synthase [Bacteroidales bacterium]|jgi:2-C-methyl-D-erythritol 2,4-cyclodiphosphate synthase|nr:2-C-methyl-D-erythritol 2,4-cyclodiphosphate synthase [Bacteroidales bacterium]